TVSVNFQLSEDSSDFGLASIQVTGGTLQNFTKVSGSLYTAEFVPAKDFEGTASIFVDSGKFHDLAGNANADGADTDNTASFTVDTKAPTATLTIDKMDDTSGSGNGDNILNIAESKTTQIITGTAGGDAKAGDTVTLTVNGKTYSGVLDSSLKFAIGVPGADLAADTSVRGEIVITDAAGNTGTANAQLAYTVDTTAPVVTIALDPITGDNKINNPESQLTDTVISGKVTGDFKAGDLVTINYPDGSSVQVTVTASGTFSTTVATSILTAVSSGTVSASIEVSDAAGNTGKGTTAETYTVNTVLPKPVLVFDSQALGSGQLGGDDILNITEAANANQKISGTVTGAQVGDTVTITVGSKTHTGVVKTGPSGDLIFEIVVPTADLIANTSYIITGTVTTTDSVSGNTGTSAPADYQYIMAAVLPKPTLTIDPVTADDIINATEAAGNVMVTGTAGGDAKAGDTVTIHINGMNYSTTVQANMTWGVSVPGADLAASANAAGQANLTGDILTTDQYGNQGVGNAQHAYTVDTVGPTPVITINTITADDIINAAESQGMVTLSGTTTDALPNDTVTVTYGSGKTITTKVKADGSWSVDVAGSDLAGVGASGNVKATVTSKDAAGNIGTSAEAIHAYAVDTTAPNPTIKLNPITGDGIINAAEANIDPATGKPIAGSQIGVGGKVNGVVGTDFMAGDVVTVTVGGKSYTGTVAQDGSFVVLVDTQDMLTAFDNGVPQVGASLAATDSAGNTAVGSDNITYSVDLHVPQPTLAIGDVTQANKQADGSYTITGTAGGDAAAGDIVVLTINGNTYQGTVQADLSWKVEHIVAGDLKNDSDTTIDGKITHTDVSGNTGIGTAVRPYDIVPPSSTTTTITLGDITAKSVSTEAADNVNNQESTAAVVISGKVAGEFTVGDTVTVTIGSSTYTATVDAAGDFSITVAADTNGNALVHNPSLTVTASIVAHDAAGNEGVISAGKSYTVNTTSPQPGIVITSLNETGSAAADSWHDDKIINAAEALGDVMVSGTTTGAKAGDWVEITLNGTSLGKAQVAADGSSYTVLVSGAALAGIGNGSTGQLVATVTTVDANGNTGVGSNTKDYSVDTTTAAVTITVNNVTADDTVNIAESAPGVMVKVSGSVTGFGTDVRQGDVVSISVNGQTYSGTVDAVGNFAVDVLGSDLVAQYQNGNHDIKASVVAHDPAGNTQTVISNPHTFNIDVTAPAPTITVSPVLTPTDINGNPLDGTTDANGNRYTADNFVNIAEGNGYFTIGGTVSGLEADSNGVYKGTVSIVINGITYSTIVTSTQADNVSWTITQVPGSGLLKDSDTTIDASVSTTDLAGNAGSGSNTGSYQLDTVKPVPTISIDAFTPAGIAGGTDTVTLSQSSGNITVKGVVGGEFNPGDIVTVTLSDGVNTATATAAVDAAGNWAVSLAGSAFLSDADLKIAASVQTVDDHGNTGSAVASRDFIIDVNQPKVEQIDISSMPTVHSPGTAAYYVAGDKIQVTVSFDDVVFVNGIPTIKLHLDNDGAGTAATGQDVTAYYVSGSGSKNLVFEYTVLSGQSDTDNVTVVADSLANSASGSIRDNNGNDAILTGGTILPEGADSQRIDAISPTAFVNWASTGDLGNYNQAMIAAGKDPNSLTDISSWDGSGVPLTDSTATGGENAAENAYEQSKGEEIGVYKIGDSIYLNVQFNEGVIITNPAAMTLTLQLTPNGGYPANIYPENRYAKFDAAHSDLTNGKIVFEYVVQAGDEDSPTANGVDAKGVSVPVNAITLNGAVITDLAGNLYNGVLNSLAENKQQYIDGVAPVNTASIESWNDAVGFYQGNNVRSDYGSGTNINTYDDAAGKQTATANVATIGNGDVSMDDPNFQLNIKVDGNKTLDVGDSINVWLKDPAGGADILIANVTQDKAV
ncbi:Ig-like domain-containing protein, partial [Stenoxybacter acetivorans]|uniref:Ig-like domain-containing protein n=1 Tax=Stenoxybacter acetivorans TaxID=422441 RepID=UPI00056781C2